MTFKPDTGCKCDVRIAVNIDDRAPHLSTDILLLHYTGMESADGALDWLCRKESKVSCHYFVYEDGRIVQSVPESRRAWHAGVSSWQGETDQNSRSIGIEIANPGHEYGYPDFPEVQINAVIELCRDILDRNEILPRNVLAHSDVAPMRKADPGEKFPWQKLHENGVGHWVPVQDGDGRQSLRLGDEGDCVSALQSGLSQYGYGVEITGSYNALTKACVVAFQRHFRQSNVDGIADVQTIATLDALVSSVS